MSLKATAGVAAVVVLGCAAGAFYWLHARSAQPVPEVTAPEPPGFHEAPPAEKTTAPSAANSPAPAETKKAPPPVDPGLPLRD